MQSLGLGGDRTTRVGMYRSENWCFLYVTLRLPARSGHLIFDLLTLKVMSESRVTWATSVPIQFLSS